MIIRVVQPVAAMLGSVADIREQIKRCAYAAGISRGRVDAEPKLGESQVLLSKLLGIKPFAHESVLEHSAVSFLFRCSRIATHEIVRHRLCAFTQSSTRYIEEGNVITVIKPPDMPVTDLGDYDLSHDDCGSVLERKVYKVGLPNPPSWVSSAAFAFNDYQEARKHGVKRESARYLLPHCLAAHIVVTANFRQWRHMIALRTHKAAAPEMRLLFGNVRGDLCRISPMLTEGL